MGSGGTVVPSQSRYVRMVAEEVVLDISDARTVRGLCTFVFTNEGEEAETLLVGFPDMSPYGSDIPRGSDQKPSVHDLRARVDGVEVATAIAHVTEKEALGGIGDVPGLVRFDWVHTWACTFAAGQTRILQTEYSHPTSTVVGDPDILHYVLRTGGTWAGSIGKVVVRVRPGALRVKSVRSPVGWEWTGTEYVWTAEGLEPTEDIDLSLEDPYRLAQCLTRTWQVMRTPDPKANPLARPHSVLQCGHLGRPDFFQAVRELLPDSLADLRNHLDSLYADRPYHGH